MRKQILVGALFGAMLLPSLVVAQAPAAPAAKCPAAVAPVSEALKQTGDTLTELIDQIGAVDARVSDYYASTDDVPATTASEFMTLKAEATKTGQVAVTEVGQLSTLELRCTPNPAASVARLNQEVAQAVNSVKLYRTAVRTELLAVRTWAEQTLGATPSPTIVPEPERLR